MKKNLIKTIYCPHCRGKFDVVNIEIKNKEIISGALICKSCGSEFPIIGYIPRLISGYNYSESWGELWKETGHLLRDSFTGVPFYHDAIFGKYSEDNRNRKGYNPFGFNWSKKLKGQKILEIGPGTGVCTEHLVETGCDLYCVDMSDAIDTFPEELLTKPNIHVIQADINLDFIPTDFFDKIWLFQVLQHTPEPPETLKRMFQLLKKGGELAYTSYGGSQRFNPWYYKFTQRINDKKAWKIISVLVPVIVPVKYWFLKHNIPLISRIILKILDPIDQRNLYYNTLEGFADQYVHGILWNKIRDKHLLYKYIIINTFDRITPRYTNNADHETNERWSRAAGFSKVKSWGVQGVRVKAVK